MSCRNRHSRFLTTKDDALVLPEETFQQPVGLNGPWTYLESSSSR